MLLKLYTASDVVNTLSMIGLKLRAVERLSIDSPYPGIYVDSLKF